MRDETEQPGEAGRVTDGDGSERQRLDTAVAAWLTELQRCLAVGDVLGLGALFVNDAEWRDLVSLTWDVQTVLGADDIASSLVASAGRSGAHDFRLAEGHVPARIVPRGGRNVLEAFLEFTTATGTGVGVLRLSTDFTQAQTLLTTLDQLHDFRESVDDNRPTLTHVTDFGGENWLDRRQKEQQYLDRDPEVVIVGCGQAGLALGARLRQLGVDALIVDKSERVGDNWRNRYHTLTLHNEVWVCHLPYMPFPATWPRFVPKDMLASWFEAYAEAMELNIWTGTEFIGAERRETTDDWTVSVCGKDGTVRELRPKHVVMASGGVSGVPNLPDIEGLQDFRGSVMHSSGYRSAADFAGRRVVVFGIGTSAHDIAQDLHSHGVQVSMIQRSSISVVSLDPSGQMPFRLYSEGWQTEDCDLIGAANAYPTVVRNAQGLTQLMLEADRELLDSLHRVGFKTDVGEDGTGVAIKYNRRGGGYYINVGCSELIADGKIGLIQSEDIATVNGSGLHMSDGSQVEADVIILATGYLNQQEEVRQLFGDQVAERVGPIWGYGDDGELRNVYRRTEQRGLWFMAGSLQQSRAYSKFLALQIKGVDEGLAFDLPRLGHGA